MQPTLFIKYLRINSSAYKHSRKVISDNNNEVNTVNKCDFNEQMPEFSKPRVRKS